jgi:hypothetical protein
MDDDTPWFYPNESNESDAGDEGFGLIHSTDFDVGWWSQSLQWSKHERGRL